MPKNYSKGVADSFKRWFLKKDLWKQIVLAFFIGFLFISGGVALWVATLRIPDLESFQQKILTGSTKIYDKTGETILFDLNQDVKQQVVPFDKISINIKEASIAIEDEGFYSHSGVDLKSFMRAAFVNLQTLKFSQGGSTITQQVIKNALLTTDKKISRKIKEWVLALKLERVMSKDEILNLYLNGTSYGGTYYGVEEASKNFFGKPASEVTIAEAAYIAAIPQAPSRYSPYGTKKHLLEARKNLVLDKMLENDLITQAEYTAAKEEKVVFQPPQKNNIKAPHFVMYVREYLIDKYGEDMVKNGGLTVVTTLDYALQEKGEEIVNRYALENEKINNAANAGLIAVDPATGQILTMVGSRDYFDDKIEGNYNVTTAPRQPGSSFKPFAYATAFNKGYTPETVLFDLPTQFSTACDPQGNPRGGATEKDCYMPKNYDSKFRGPMNLRNALAQSINIPAIKVLYLAGMRDTLQTAQDMGITTLTTPERYGLTMVLGGGEVTLLEMTSAYATFANDGMRNAHTPILKVTTREGKVLEEFIPNPKQVIPEQSALLINNILSDNNARLPLFSAGSKAMFYDREVALKTGTTNDLKDVWVIGYTPQITVGSWAGNNNNASMKQTSGAIIVPLWRAFMDEALKELPTVSFKRPEPTDPSLKPILRGIWNGGQTITFDRTTGQLATDQTSPENREERTMGGGDVHSILYYVDKDNPTGPAPSNPSSDSQFNLWETPIRAWAQANGNGSIPLPGQGGPNNTPDAIPTLQIVQPMNGGTFNRTDNISIFITHQNKFPIKRAEFFLNNNSLGSSSNEPLTVTFSPQNANAHPGSNTLRVVLYDQYDNKGESSIQINVRD